MMNFIHKLVKDLIENSPVIVKAVNAIEGLRTDVNHLTYAVLKQTTIVDSHHDAIKSLFASQTAIIATLKGEESISSRAKSSIEMKPFVTSSKQSKPNLTCL